MNNLLQVVHSEIFERSSSAVASALVAGLWQGIALAVLTAIILRLLPRTTAAARFIIWIAVFAASAAMPLLHLATSTQSAAFTLPSHLLLDPRWSYFLAALWLAAAIFRLTMLVVEAAVLRQLWQTAKPISEETLQGAGLQAAVAVRGIQVCTTSDVDRPSVIGFFAPRILIPSWLLAELSETELRHIVLHEMEHLRRRDDWLNLLQKIGLVLFPLNPAMFWIDRRLSTEREIACDDGVLARTNAPRAYASSLTSIAERRLSFSNPRRMVALALGALGAGALLRRRSEFATRIESILGQRPASRPALAVFLVAGVLGGTAVMAHAPDLVTFGSTAAPTAASISTTPDRVLSGSREFAPSAKFETASYHTTTKQAQASIAQNHRAKRSGSRPKAIPTVAVRLAEDRSAIEQRTAGSSSKGRSENQWMVLTSWEETPPQRSGTMPVSDSEPGTDPVIPVSRVIVRTPDGRFFVAPYAAVPTRAGWLIVQL